MNAARALLHRVGYAVRESGQALERVGCRLQGIYSYEEKCECRSRSWGDSAVGRPSTRADALPGAHRTQ